MGRVALHFGVGGQFDVAFDGHLNGVGPVSYTHLGQRCDTAYSLLIDRINEYPIEMVLSLIHI